MRPHKQLHTNFTHCPSLPALEAVSGQCPEKHSSSGAKREPHGFAPKGRTARRMRVCDDDESDESGDCDPSNGLFLHEADQGLAAAWSSSSSRRSRAFREQSPAAVSSRAKSFFMSVAKVSTG